MRIRLAALLGVALLFDGGFSSGPAAQTAMGGTQLVVGTWSLVALERADAQQTLARIRNPTGILIQDAKGNVLEIATHTGRSASLNLAEQVMTYQAFWGTYSVDPNRPAITYGISGDLDPGRMGQQIVRSFERKGSQLVLTESAPGAGVISRATWQRLSELEALPEYQQGVVGFWQWVSAGLVNTSGTMVQPASRDSSVILYTPTGHMAVIYLPPPGRKKFAAATPTVEEARAALQGSVSYFGTYVVQPKSGYVLHYQLGSRDPAAVGASFQRNFEVRGSELVLIFPPTMLNGQQVRNTIHLKRLSGLGDMWPEFRR